MGPETPAFGGRTVRVSISVQGGEAEIERILSEVVRALAGEGAPGVAHPPRPRNPLEPEAGPAEDRADHAERPALEDLTSREVEVLDHVARGYDNATIAQHLGISTRTVRNHLNSVFSKLNVAYRPQAVVLAREAGLGR
ncbi:MAG TPA: LuxR C-terminal-related transcriptional regulator [Trueperaceae bacterium]|nr:LuxR C-terminal-related transcriptional regulator [Trueperaceae bacterium]